MGLLGAGLSRDLGAGTQASPEVSVVVGGSCCFGCQLRPPPPPLCAGSALCLGSRTGNLTFLGPV